MIRLVTVGTGTVSPSATRSSPAHWVEAPGVRVLMDCGAGTIHRLATFGLPWLEIKCSRCLTPCDVDLCALRHVPTTCVHDLAQRLVCQKCRKAGKRPVATLLQLTPRSQHQPDMT